MEPNRGLETLLGTIRLWLERAGDDEVLALYRIVRAEMTKRRFRHTPIPPEDNDEPAGPRTPANDNS